MVGYFNMRKKQLENKGKAIEVDAGQKYEVYQDKSGIAQSMVSDELKGKGSGVLEDQSSA